MTTSLTPPLRRRSWTVIAGKALHQQTGELILAAHEHVLPGNKHVIQHGQALAADNAVVGVALVNGALALAVIVGLTAEDVGHAGGVHGDAQETAYWPRSPAYPWWA